LAVVFLAVSLSVHAQQRIYRIAYLRAEPPPPSYIEAFRQGLRENGYIEGKNAVVDVRWTDGEQDKLRAAAAEFVRLKADVIVASAPAATRAAMDATSSIPIVMVQVADPVSFKFVASLSHPGGNVTGLAYLLPELNGKRLALLKEVVPKLSRVAVLWNGNNPYKPIDLAEVQKVADALRIEVLGYPVRNPGEFDTAFAAASKKGAQGLITLEDPFTIANRSRIIELARGYRLPALYGLRIYVDAGGWMSYGPDPIDQNLRAGAIVDKLLKGAKPADIPVEQPTKFEFVINQATGRSAGFAVPPSVLIRADHVID
jgi:putative ABC transport system substrate-binding protein